MFGAGGVVYVLCWNVLKNQIVVSVGNIIKGIFYISGILVYFAVMITRKPRSDKTQYVKRDKYYQTDNRQSGTEKSFCHKSAR